MAHLHAGETLVTTAGELPAVGAPLPAINLVNRDWSAYSPPSGQRLIISAYPSVDTGVCSASVRRFNELAAGLDNTTIVNVSMDLPFALSRFCGAEGIERVVVASSFSSTFGDDFGLRMLDGPLPGLLARAVIVADASGTVVYTQVVPILGTEPDYDAAIAALG